MMYNAIYKADSSLRSIKIASSSSIYSVKLFPIHFKPIIASVISLASSFAPFPMVALRRSWCPWYLLNNWTKNKDFHPHAGSPTQAACPPPYLSMSLFKYYSYSTLYYIVACTFALLEKINTLLYFPSVKRTHCEPVLLYSCCLPVQGPVVYSCPGGTTSSWKVEYSSELR